MKTEDTKVLARQS